MQGVREKNTRESDYYRNAPIKETRPAPEVDASGSRRLLRRYGKNNQELGFQSNQGAGLVPRKRCNRRRNENACSTWETARPDGKGGAERNRKRKEI